VNFISIPSVTLALLIAIPVAVFLVEVVAAIALPQQNYLVDREECFRAWF
jgi:hypothetical protein